jgi:trehalose/maltose transport system substrate-binding protein
LLAVALTLAVAVAGCGGDSPDKSDDGTIVLRMSIDPIGDAMVTTEALARQYEAANPGVRIEVVPGPGNVSERLVHYLSYIGARSQAIDILQVDIIWTGLLADHLVDLRPALAGELDDFIPALVENNTVGGRLVAAPWYTNIPLLYYRADLLDEHGFEAPPHTWDELEAQAAAIQQAKRSIGATDFHGFVFHATPDEGLTCVAYEWLVSHGGGRLVDRDGRMDLDPGAAAGALARAHGWLGSISPERATEGNWNRVAEDFMSGRAAFARNWTYMVPLLERSDLAGVYGVAPMPAGPAGGASTLGGWQLAVSKNSRHREEAVRFVEFLVSPEALRRRALEGGFLPPRLSVLDDPAVAGKVAGLDQMRAAFESAVPRPSTSTGYRYNEVSVLFSDTVGRVLDGELEAEAAARRLESELPLILSRL